MPRPDLRDLPDPTRTSASTSVREPPASAGILERWVYDQAKRRDVPAARLRNAISYMALAGALDRNTDGQGRPRFMLKGAVTLELRFQGRGRMTEDLDVSVIPRGDVLELFDAALREPYRDFAFVRDAKVHAMPNGVRRVRVKLRYRTKPWATVPVDLSRIDHDDVEAERIPALDLSVYGLRGPVDVACLSLRYQIAQKLHAATAVPPDGRPNDRFRDMADVLLMRGLVTNHAALREACENIFRWRDTHAWPPTVGAPEAWRQGYAALAEELHLTPARLDDALIVLREFIDVISRA